MAGAQGCKWVPTRYLSTLSTFYTVTPLPCVFGDVLTLKSLPFDHASILSSGTQDVSHNALEI